MFDRANRLLTRGLDRYAKGDFLGALSEWEHAQALLPEGDLAGEYIAFVTENFDVLSACQDGDENARRAAAELDVPFGLVSDIGDVSDDDDDDDAYELVVLETGDSEEDAALRESAEALAQSLEAAAAIDDWLDDVDTGWVLPADAVRALPPPPSTPLPPEADLAEALAEVSAGLMAGLGDASDDDDGRAKTFDLALDLSVEEPDTDLGAAPSDLELGLAPSGEGLELAPSGMDLGLAGARPDMGPQPRGGVSGAASVVAAADGEDDTGEDDTGEATRERSMDQGLDLDFGLGPAGVASHRPHRARASTDVEEPEEPTVELRAHARAVDQSHDDDEVTVPGGEEPPPFNPSVHLSDDALAALSMRGDGVGPDEPTVERSGAGRFPLSELSALDGATLRDDRIDLDDELQPEVKVTFRGGAGPSSRRDLGDDEPTVDRGMMVSLDEEEQTIERGGGAGGWSAGAPAVSRAPTMDPLLPSPNVIVDDHLLSEMDETGEHKALLDPGPGPVAEFAHAGTPTTAEIGRPAALLSNFGVAARVPAAQPTDVAEHILADVGRTVVAGETEDERIRRRVTQLIQRGAAEDEASNPAVAATAIDLALSENPESIVAQKVIHRHRDLVIEIFEHYIGDLAATPTLALPLHEIPQQSLDNRSAFLLSRIDGSISFEEILDVAGMTQLEALRLLCKMLLNGILHVV